MMISSQIKPSEKANMMSGATSLSSSERSKAWHMELFMERLRSRSNQLKSFLETSKAVRMGLLDKRHSLDSVEKSQLQKSLDALQHEIKVTSLQGFVERLESLTRQLGLKFMVGQSGVELFISSEMFYLEILLENNGAVKDVKVNHDGKSSGTCDEFVRCLSQGDFNDFACQLEGLANLYQINAEKKVKAKAFVALQALEADLGAMYQLQNFIKNPVHIIHRCSVGALQKRRGGHPMKLTYFISAYELINKDKKCAEPLTLENVLSNSLGCSVTVSIEGSGMHELQIVSIVTPGRGAPGTPSYAPLSPTTSVMLPACFVLRLNQPMPLCVALATRLHQITGLEVADFTTTHPMLSLITQHISKGNIDSVGRGLFVSLPDQLHCYFMTERRGLEGVLINRVPFTHPAHVPQALAILRQQALFNELIASCIRPNSKQDPESALMFELCPLTWQHISITLERPYHETVSTFEIDLSSISTVRCKLFSGGSKCTETLTDHLSKVLQRCLSIPVTMRALLKLWQEEKYDHNNLNDMNGGNFSLGLGSDDPGGNSSGSNGGPGGFSDHKLKLDTTMQQTMKHNAFMSDGQVTTMSNLFTSNTVPEVDKAKCKRPASEELWEVSPKRVASDNEILVDSSSNDSASCDTRASMISDGGLAERTPTSATGFPSDLDLSVVDPSDMVEFSERTNSDLECSGDGVSLDEDAVDILKAKKSKKLERKNSILMELSDGKSFIPPSVSITPISSSTTNFNSVLSGMGLERRPGIEIIPIASAPAVSFPSSITITPITSSSHSQNYSDEQRKDRSSSGKSRSSEEKKKRRKRREDSSSPKMGPPGMKLDGSPSKPRSSEHSPSKHSTSGKPSMSSLKSSSSSSCKVKDPNKIKSSNIKLKQLDISIEPQSNIDECVISPSSSLPDSMKCQAQVQARNRKGSLSAVIDKLKSAQSSGVIEVEPRFQQNSAQAGKNTEYMVKPSSDGMKITINKTRTGKTPSGSGSPKTHTGLKPGVNSGPASKKPQQFSNKIPLSGGIMKSTSISEIKAPGSSMSLFTKTTNSSSLNLSSSTKSSKPAIGSPKSNLSLDKGYNRDKPRSMKVSEKGVFKGSETKRSSPAPSRDETDNDRPMKLAVSQQGLPPQLVVEGLIKSLDTKFQIPKLSQRTGDDVKKSVPIEKTSTPLLSLNDANDRSSLDVNTKIFSDFLSNKESSGKYSYSSSMKQLDTISKVAKNPIISSNTSVSLTVSSSKTSISSVDSNSFQKEVSKMDNKSAENRLTFINSLQMATLNKDDGQIKDYCKQPSKLSSLSTDFSLTKSVDITKFSSHPINKQTDEGKRTPDALLDFSSKSDSAMKANSPINMATTNVANRFSSPSVSLHFVKSPVPSPLLGMNSAHSNSPRMDNDELMDETLVGIGK